jgi:hypothetical protein
MGEKGNVADAASIAGGGSSNIVTDTLSSGVELASGVATGVVTGVATGLAKDKVEDKLKRDDEPTG